MILSTSGATSFQLRSNFAPTSVQLRSNFGPISVQLRSNCGPKMFQLRSSLVSNIAQLRSNFGPCFGRLFVHVTFQFVHSLCIYYTTCFDYLHAFIYPSVNVPPASGTETSHPVKSTFVSITFPTVVFRRAVRSICPRL